jgi:hypothetical protein
MYLGFHGYITYHGYRPRHGSSSSVWPLIAEAQDHTQVSRCEICGRVALGQVLFEVLLLSITYHHGPPHSYIIWRMNNRPTGGHRPETSSHPIHMNNNNNYYDYCGLSMGPTMVSIVAQIWVQLSHNSDVLTMVTNLQLFIVPYWLVQVFHPSQNSEHSPFWNSWSYSIKSYDVEVAFNDITSLQNFIKIYDLVQK